METRLSYEIVFSLFLFNIDVKVASYDPQVWESNSKDYTFAPANAESLQQRILLETIMQDNYYKSYAGTISRHDAVWCSTERTDSHPVCRRDQSSITSVSHRMGCADVDTAESNPATRWK